uniref:Uncharacterized protein n=1 Tax=Anguilla anguilla TaxID=7936 RepID=A0A0E9SJB5_ANGAN
MAGWTYPFIHKVCDCGHPGSETTEHWYWMNGN